MTETRAAESRDEQVDALRAFADVTRLRLLGLLAGRPMTADELASAARLAPAALARHLERLAAAGLVSQLSPPDGTFELRVDRINELARGVAGVHRERERDEAATSFDGVEAADARVLRAFVRDGRLTSIPAQDSKKRVVLRYLLEQCFAEDRSYPEREVNERLRAWNEDVAALRRYLVDGGYMTRSGGEYRRG